MQKSDDRPEDKMVETLLTQHPILVGESEEQGIYSDWNEAITASGRNTSHT